MTIKLKVHWLWKALLALAILCLLCVTLFVRAVLYVPPDVLHQSTPTSAESSQALVNLGAIQMQWEWIAKEQARFGRSRPFEFRVSEADLNTAIRGRFSDYFGKHLDIPELRNTNIRFRIGVVELSGLTRWRDRTFFVAIQGEPKISGPDAIRFPPTQVQIGKWIPPGFIQRRIIGELSRRTSQFTIPTPAPVSKVRVEPGWLIIKV